MMLRYRAHNLIRTGIIGLVLAILVVAVGLQPERLTSWATSLRYQALFSEAGGLAAGNDVTVSGMKVGTVSAVSLENGDALVTFTLRGNVQVGGQSRAHIRTDSLLGKRVLDVESVGSGRLRPSAVIPIARTSSPYSLTEAVDDLTANVAGTNTQALNHSLDTLSATLDKVAPQLGPAFDGLSRLSQSLNSRNETVGQLLKTAGDVTGILSERSQQVNTLILDANDLLEVLVRKRNAIVQLLANTSAVAKQLTGLVNDNEQKLAPALDKLNSVTAMLEKNRDTIAKALPGLAKYQLTASETVANGPYTTAYAANLIPGQLVQPFVDRAFGFRNGSPDMPRALFPWPHNGIPGGSR